MPTSRHANRDIEKIKKNNPTNNFRRRISKKDGGRTPKDLGAISRSYPSSTYRKKSNICRTARKNSETKLAKPVPETIIKVKTSKQSRIIVAVRDEKKNKPIAYIRYSRKCS